MSISFYDATVTPIKAALQNMRNVMHIGQKFCQENGVDESDMLGRKLFEDMFDLRTQVLAVQLLAAHQGALRVAGIVPSQTNRDIQTFAQADELLKTLAEDVEKIDVDTYNAAMMNPVQCDLPIGSAHFETALDHLQQWVIPHLYFHVTTAYNILRHNGVPLGKAAYLGEIDMRLEKGKS